MDKGIKSLWLAVVLVMAVAAFQAAPATAQNLYPEGWSMNFDDVVGATVECVDFIRCNSARCPADAFFSGKRGTYDNITSEFEGGRTRTTAFWRNVDWGSGFVTPVWTNTREVYLDVTCSRIGPSLWGFGGFSFAPFSCGAEATYRRIDQYGGNFSFNQGLAANVIGGRARCADLWGAAAAKGRIPEKILHPRAK
jgi:hypothetical protein